MGSLCREDWKLKQEYLLRNSDDFFYLIRFRMQIKVID